MDEVVTCMIDYVPGSIPLRFRWRQVVGPTIVQHEGCLPPSIENVVRDLIDTVKKQNDIITELREKLEEAEKRPKAINPVTDSKPPLRGKK